MDITGREKMENENLKLHKRAKAQLIIGIVLIAVFIVYTVSLKFVNVLPIGPNDSSVAYASINKAVHELFGVHMTLYDITDWAGVVTICVALGFAVLGIVQLIKRKSILKVDSNILTLGVFYIIVFGVFAFFELNVINHRPVLIEGVLESSYPSSTTMLATCVLPTAIFQFNRLIKKTWLRNTVNIACGLFTVFMVVVRLICGVHWFTDIIGGLIFSIGMIFLYVSVNGFIDIKKNETTC